MSALMEYMGDDVDQAIRSACAALGVPREELEIQVVSTGSAGFLGLGRKKAVIKVRLRSEKDKRSGRQPRANKTAASAAESRTRRPERAGAADDTEEGDQEALVAPLSDEEWVKLQAMVSRLLELSGFMVRPEIGPEQGDGIVRVDLVGDDSELLAGSEGQILDAIQYLLRKMLSKQLGRRVILDLDAGDYRARRRLEMEERALALAAEVKSSGKSRTMPAMGPAERRIVHLTLQSDSEIRSRSVGEGLFKKILIHPPGKGRKRLQRPRGRGRK